MKRQDPLKPPVEIAEPSTPSMTTSILAGGFAGTATDVITFPLDTIKTRLQSSAGFSKGGGWNRLYSGIGPVFLGSAPQASIFFLCYDSVKKFSNSPGKPSTHMMAAVFGELLACTIRVPTENVKQKIQAGLQGTIRGTCQSMLTTDGFMGFFVGFGATVFRDVPFSFVQFPLWEALKVRWSKFVGGRTLHNYESALCGSAAAALAGFFTTPLDVVKTRLMLGQDTKGVRYEGTMNTMVRIITEEGAGALFSGALPRTIWVGVGGIIFFGGYELAWGVLEDRSYA